MEIKKVLSFLIVFIFIIVFTSITVYSMTLKKELDECLKNSNNTDIITNTNDTTNNTHTYDCTFTLTYRIVDMLDNYIAEVPESSYIIVDKFQTHQAIAHYIPTNLKKDLKVNHNYEFTYHIKGKGTINDIYDVINTIHQTHTNNDNLSTTITIKETNKTGLDQIQENICNFQN